MDFVKKTFWWKTNKYWQKGHFKLKKKKQLEVEKKLNNHLTSYKNLINDLTREVKYQQKDWQKIW